MAPDPYRYFRVEARELVDDLLQAAMQLEKRASPDLVSRLLRAAHTLKGAARVVKQREIADRTHALEDALAPYRDSSSTAPRECIDQVLGLLDEINHHLGLLAPTPAPPATSQASLATSQVPPAASPASPAAAEVEGQLPTRSLAEETFRMLRADVGEMDELLEGMVEVQAQVGLLRRSLSEMERGRHLLEVLAGQIATPRDEGSYDGVASGPKPQPTAGQGVRAIAEELRAVFGGLERSLGFGVDQVDRELRQVRSIAERLRLVPAGALFTSLERTARDAAQTLGKSVTFEGRGADVRLDAHVLGGVQKALVQAVRNAVAHGIEKPDERRALGKSPFGRVTLSIARKGRRISFTCSDDGRGIDLEGVRRAAERRGLPGTTEDLGVEDLLGLLLKGGITTSGTVTEMSGRGIGLDVVREAVERLGGNVVVRTEAGKGTEVELDVPLSLASVEGLSVEASGTVATIPLEAVRQALRIAASDVARTPDGESIVHEGKVIPFMRLSRALSNGHETSGEPKACSAVIVRGDRGDVAALGVDRLLGTGTVVLRPLPYLAPAAAIVAGASLDAEGNPQIMLDPGALVSEASHPSAHTPEPEVRSHPILVIDDSLTTRMLEQSILESSGYEVDVATSGEDGLEKASKKHYALFLVDIEMPGIDGFTFVERIRADPKLQRTPAILVSSRNAPEDFQRGERVGAQGYIVKSEFNQGALLERIRRLVG